MYIHKSVLLNEAIEALNIKKDGIYVDATLGGAGHTREILKRLDNGKVIAFDQDIYAINRAKEIDDPNLIVVNSNFKNVKDELLKLGYDHIDGILYDLGVSSFQFDIPERGFSYNYDAILDMRMDQSQSLMAKDIVNNYSFNELVNIFNRYGDEPFSKQIARKIEKARELNEINTTFELVEIIKSALPQKVLNSKGHPAKRVFQALRIAVNDELRVFEKSLYDIIDVLNKDARIVVISFHSLEDRICKSIFKEKSIIDVPKGVPIIIDEIPDLEIITKHPITPSVEELEYNNRAHSAKMRVARKN